MEEYQFTLKKKGAHDRHELYWDKSNNWWLLYKIKNKDNTLKRTYTICRDDWQDWERFMVETLGWYKDE